MIYGIIINRGITLLRQFKCIVMRCVMDIKILTKRYKTPSYIKGIGSLLFIAVIILMIALPVFELIPQEQYANVFNLNGSAKGNTYDSTSYTIFQMMEYDYGSGLAMGIMLTQCILSAVAGIALLWMNRPKLALIPTSLICWTVIFSVFRATSTMINPDVNAKILNGHEFWTEYVSSPDSIVASMDQLTLEKATKGTYIQRYTIDGKNYIFNTFGRYWLLWVGAFLLLVCSIAAIIVTKTLIEKKKK